MKKIKKAVLTGGVLFALFCLGFVSCPSPSTSGGTDPLADIAAPF